MNTTSSKKSYTERKRMEKIATSRRASLIGNNELFKKMKKKNFLLILMNQ